MHFLSFRTHYNVDLQLKNMKMIKVRYKNLYILYIGNVNIKELFPDVN